MSNQPEQEHKVPTFKTELEHLINKHSLENASNTPDYIIAEYLVMCYSTLCEAISARDIHNE